MNREYQALKIRYEALSRDWHRQRDVEREWRTLRDRIFYALAFIAGLMSVLIITGAI